jgi:ribonuclease HII
MAKRVPSTPLQPYYDPATNQYEIGIDEAGRGPMFGRVYVAGVVLPHPSENSAFRYEDMKDSKKFHSETKIRAVAEYIKTNAVAWHVAYVEPNMIDTINIRQAVLRGMHECARECLRQLQTKQPAINVWQDAFLLVDGNDFTPYTQFDATADTIMCMRHETVEGGDNTYCSIAAASILAKVSRDTYIHDLCVAHPVLNTRYQLDKNKGYGTKVHLDGIRAHGITQWHRQSFGLCHDAPLHPITVDDTCTLDVASQALDTECKTS